jgi:hypothetical protein
MEWWDGAICVSNERKERVLNWDFLDMILWFTIKREFWSDLVRILFLIGARIWRFCRMKGYGNRLMHELKFEVNFRLISEFRGEICLFLWWNFHQSSVLVSFFYKLVTVVNFRSTLFQIFVSMLQTTTEVVNFVWKSQNHFAGKFIQLSSKISKGKFSWLSFKITPLIMTITLGFSKQLIG